jgi:hypothetical protein
VTSNPGNWEQVGKAKNSGSAKSRREDAAGDAQKRPTDVELQELVFPGVNLIKLFSFVADDEA